MNVFNKYNIAFKGLGAGTHHFGFDVEDDLFEAFEGSEIKGGKAHADVALTKAGSSLTLDFVIRGEVVVECDRCLDDCAAPVDYEGQLAVKFSEEQMEPGEEYDGEVLWLRPGEGEVNVAQYIYESIVLSLPFQRIHPDREDGKPGCNPETLRHAGMITEEEFERISSSESYTVEQTPEAEKLMALKAKLEAGETDEQ